MITMAAILLADDDHAVYELLRMGLEVKGHYLDWCADGRTAVARATEKVFDLMIFDYVMPPSNGLMVFKKIREGTINQTTPVILLTGDDSTALSAKALRAGVSAIIIKPFLPSQIYKTLAPFLEGKS